MVCPWVSGALGIPPAVAACLLSSATSSSQPHVTHSASTQLPGKPQPATPFPAPPQTTEKIPCFSQFCCFMSFPLLVTQLGSALLAVSTFPPTDASVCFRLTLKGDLTFSLKWEECRLTHIGYSNIVLSFNVFRWLFSRKLSPFLVILAFAGKMKG